MAGCVRVLLSGSRTAGLVSTLFMVLGMSFACSPVPYSTSSDSPYARPVKPEDLYYEEADQGPPRIEPGDSLEVVVRRGGGEERSLVTVRDNGRVYVGSLDIEVKNLTTTEAEAKRLTVKVACREAGMQPLLNKPGFAGRQPQEGSYLRFLFSANAQPLRVASGFL